MTLVTERLSGNIRFREIPGYPGYWVSDVGGWIWSDKSQKYLQVDFSRGYGQVALQSNLGEGTNTIHTLVLTAFVGPKPEGKMARHFPDRNKANNDLSNLQWGTAEENTADRRVHGTMVGGKPQSDSVLAGWKRNGYSGIGEGNHNCKISSETALEVKKLLASSLNPAEVSKILNLPYSTVYSIKSNKSWTHLTLEGVNK